jgi:hypothetical protein
MESSVQAPGRWRQTHAPSRTPDGERARPTDAGRRTSGPANTSPLEGFQFFGEVAIDGGSEALTVHLRDQAEKVLHTVTLDRKH